MFNSLLKEESVFIFTNTTHKREYSTIIQLIYKTIVFNCIAYSISSIQSTDN